MYHPNSLSVCHLSTYQNIGGAAIAAWRLHEALQNHPKVDSTFYCGYQLNSIVQKTNNRLPILFPNLRQAIRSRVGSQLTNTLVKGGMYENSSNLLPSNKHRLLNALRAHIIHIHWIHSDFISIKSLTKVRKPMIITLHDNWWINLTEHHLNPPGIQANTPQFNESFFSRTLLNQLSSLKLQLINRSDVRFVCPSTWVYSRLIEKYPSLQSRASIIHHAIPAAFVPRDRAQARKVLKLSQHQKIVLFLSSYTEAKITKGWHYLRCAMSHVSTRRSDLLLITLTKERFKTEDDFPFEHLSIDYSSDEHFLSTLFSAVNCTANPSLLETFGLVSAESLATGTPVVAFQGTGMDDFIQHKVNGYLAKPYSDLDFAKGIDFCLQPHVLTQENILKLTSNSILNPSHMAAEHEDLYHSCLTSNG